MKKAKKGAKKHEVGAQVQFEAEVSYLRDSKPGEMMHKWLVIGTDKEGNLRAVKVPDDVGDVKAWAEGPQHFTSWTLKTEEEAADHARDVLFKCGKVGLVPQVKDAVAWMKRHMEMHGWDDGYRSTIDGLEAALRDADVPENLEGMK